MNISPLFKIILRLIMYNSIKNEISANILPYVDD